MRIKVLIFPLFLVISISTLIFYAKPEYDKEKIAKSEIETKQKELADIQAKQDNLKKLSASLDQNKEKEIFVKSFFPEKRGEEEIINSLNFMATNSGVILSNIAGSKPQTQAPPPPPPPAEATTSKEAIFGTGHKEAAQVSAPVVPVSMEALNYKVYVIGSYESITNFLDQLYRLEMLNNIAGFAIAKVEKSGQDEEGGAEIPVGTLMLQADLNFSYMSQVKIGKNYSSPLFSSPAFNYTVYDKLSALIRKNTPVLEAGNASRTNPFLP